MGTLEELKFGLLSKVHSHRDTGTFSPSPEHTLTLLSQLSLVQCLSSWAMGSLTAPRAGCTATYRERCSRLSCARRQSFSCRTKQVSPEIFSLYIHILFISL